jgi:para-aminobenzoate synthetase component 1
MRVVPLALRRDPTEVLASLADEPGAFLLDVPDAVEPVTLVGCAPAAELCVHAATEGDALAAIERFVDGVPRDAPFPYAGVIGWLAYEFGRFTEPPRRSAPRRPAVPLAVLRRYDALLVFDRNRAQWALASRTSSRAPWLERLAAPPPVWSGPLARAPLAPVVPRERMLAALARIREYLVAGDVYQVNLTQPFAAPLAAPAWALLAALARRHPAPYSAYLDLGDTQIVANSPELFLRRRGRSIETRPIKGTRPRAAARARDAGLAAELVADAKERAEHVMIVDLERNDLGRVCETGSIRVAPFARVESHPTVHHLVSTVSGCLRPDAGLAALLRATFPGGSITGAPKVRAMEIIAELEGHARGAYTGAFGIFHPAGDLELGLAIRTAVVDHGTVRWDAGGGIVADSDPERELAEAWLKTAALRVALGEDERAPLEQCSSG